MAKRATRAAKAQSVLIELLTEELPPKSLRDLAVTFGTQLSHSLHSAGLASADGPPAIFATPRRLAVRVPGVVARGPDVRNRQGGPSVSAGAQAVQGFAKKHGLAPEQLEREQTPKGEIWVAHYTTPGAVLRDILAAKVEQAIKALPVRKLMRWGDGEHQFARPVHGLIMLHGSRPIPGEVLGRRSGNRTLGHRFLCKGPVTITHADKYEAILEKRGRVIASFDTRRSMIAKALDRGAARLGGDASWKVGGESAVLDEVTGIVEFPHVQAGAFDGAFLEVPRECLIVSMQQHQRYFPIGDGAGKLRAQFLFVANIPASANGPVVRGNERVLRARLADAKFFYDQDRRARLETRVPKLAGVVFHNKLGSQLERVERIRLLAAGIAKSLRYDAETAGRAAFLAKADLLTEMVGEFPELQGTMGRYYALHDGEPAAVADAVGEHYQPRFAGDALPANPAGVAVALADKLDLLAGMFGALQTPTGEKDPFGMRRAALGIVRILIERDLPLSIYDLIKSAFSGYRGRVGEATNFLETFIFERLGGWCREQGYPTLQVEAVVSPRPALIHLVPKQLEAVRAFNALPEADSLIAANKRVANILRQASIKTENLGRPDPALLSEEAERALHEALRETSKTAAKLSGEGDFTGSLKALAMLKAPVDQFFDKVMVMVDDATLRRNRLALLSDLRGEMNRLADISRLSA